MHSDHLPEFLTACLMSHKDAMRRTVQSGRCIASGFATSEPHAFYSELWDYIEQNDIRDFTIKQALFMAPHRVCVGDALSSKGLFSAAAQQQSSSPWTRLARQANLITKKLEGLKALVSHYEELKRRNIKLVTPFMGAASNMVIPSNPVTRMLYPEYVGRNSSRLGITDMHSVHFSEAVDAIGYDADKRPLVDTFICVMTPPNAQGELSHGAANGANGEILENVLERCDIDLLLYLNPRYPFTRGYGDAPNTLPVESFRKLAQAGRLLVVQDESKVPALPAGALQNPTDSELKIAHNVVNHIELNRAYTYGRAMQVGFGSTGVLAIRALKDSSWRGRSYTEMLEPYTLDLFDSGKIEGSHFIERDGRRTQLDGKMVCTFTLGEEGSDFYERINNHPALILASAARVVIPEGFYYGLGVNNCLAVDFHGHVNSGGRYRNHHSGIGGAAHIHRGLARGGVSYLCLKSTYRNLEGQICSAIVPFMPEGTPISHVGPDLMGGREGARFFLVTEYGVAQLSGRSQANFIKALISVAHPDFRGELRRAAWDEFRVSV